MLQWSQDSKVGTMTRPWLRQFGVLIPGSSKNILHKCPDRLWGPPHLLFSVYWEFLLQVQTAWVRNWLLTPI
jgi:hypothetical protein